MNTTYKYVFVNETVEIEISEEWTRVLKESDRQEYNNDQTERRRHTGLDMTNEYSGWLADSAADPLEIIIRQETESEIEMIAEEVLTDKQLSVFRLVLVKGYTIDEAAELLGFSYQSAWSLLERSKERMMEYRKNFEE